MHEQQTEGGPGLSKCFFVRRMFRSVLNGLLMLSSVVLCSFLLSLSLCCAELFVFAESVEFDEAPSLDALQQARNKQQAQKQQEAFRICVPIGDAVGENVQVDKSLMQAQATSREQHEATISGDKLLVAALFLITGVLVIIRVSPNIAEYINQRTDPWKTAASFAETCSTKVRSDEEAVTEFLSAFWTGPKTPGGAQPIVLSAKEAALLKEFFERASEIILKLGKLLEEIRQATNVSNRQPTLVNFYNLVRDLKNSAGISALLPVWQLATALEGLLKQFTGASRDVTVSTLRTISGAVALLQNLCVPGLRPDLLNNPPIRFLTVDNDPVSRSAVSFALKRALSAPDLAASAKEALALARRHSYDVIFLDVAVSGMDGFELCRSIHEAEPNRTTPVVFVTSHNDFEARVKSTLSGGDDLIVKPFLTFEITLKALTLVMERRLQNRSQPIIGQSAESQPPANVATFSVDDAADSRTETSTEFELPIPDEVGSTSPRDLSPVTETIRRERAGAT